MIQVVYTNLNCNDVFTPFYKQNRKHCNLPLYAISDYDINLNIDGFFKYKNNEPYYKVWVDALTKFNSEYFIYLQEDFFLYDDVKEEIVEEYKKELSNSKYSFVRLLKSGQLESKKIFNNLYEIDSSNKYIFSMQSTIWKTKDYIKLMNMVQSKIWYDEHSYRGKMIELNMKGLYHFEDELKIGSNHHNSNVYPYIATAVVKGKWNYKEYGEKLNKILMKNNINPEVRGKF